MSPSPEKTGPTIHELASPPKPRLAFRVGVTGHRPNRLGGAEFNQLAAVLREILETVQSAVSEVEESHAEFHDTVKPAYLAISPLAEGVDRIFAEVALDLGWDLCCVMPFHQEDYEKDFSGEHALESGSLARFHSILHDAREADRLTCLQLDGSRGEEHGNPYGTGGKVVLDLSDLLIVVWDGDRSRDMKGGTAETLADAKTAGIPIVVIDAKAPHNWPRHDNNSLKDISFIKRAVKDLLAIPNTNPEELAGFHGTSDTANSASGRRVAENPPGNGHQERELREYYLESRPSWSTAFIWKLFRDIVGGGDWRKSFSLTVKPFEMAVSQEWPAFQDRPSDGDNCNPRRTDRVIDQLRPFYAWPDRLADVYANRYRGAYLMSYLLAALAVGLALLPAGLDAHHWENVCTALELTSILFILFIFLLSRARRWHERWLDYRLAAELIRHLRVVAPICGKPPFPHVPTHHLAHGQPEGTWMNWYLRAVTRSLPAGDIRFDHDFLRQYLAGLKELLVGQRTFHETNETLSHRIEHRLHGGIIAMLALTLLACLSHLFHVPLPGHLLTFLCGFLPAVGATLAGINNQGEFRRVMKRSQAMRTGIGKLIQRIDELLSEIPETRPESASSDKSASKSLTPEVRKLSADAANLLLREVLDWRVLFIDRPPEVGP